MEGALDSCRLPDSGHCLTWESNCSVLLGQRGNSAGDSGSLQGRDLANGGGVNDSNDRGLRLSQTRPTIGINTVIGEIVENSAKIPSYPN